MSADEKTEKVELKATATQLQRRLRRNWLLKVVALALAFLLWRRVDQSASVSFGDTVPVKLKLAPGMTEKVISPPAVKVTLEYQRGAVEESEVREFRIEVNHDLSAYTDPQTVVFQLEDRELRIPARSRIKSIDPRQIKVEIDRLEKKMLPVRVALEDSPRRGYRVIERRSSPPEVQVEGPGGVLEGIGEILTEMVNIRGRSTTFEQVVSFQPPGEFVRVMQPRGTVRVEIGRELKEREFSDVPVNLLLRPRARFDSIRIEPREVTLRLKGPEAVLNNLLLPPGAVYVNLVELDQLQSGTYELPFRTDLPPEVTLEHSEPARIKVILGRPPQLSEPRRALESD